MMNAFSRPATVVCIPRDGWNPRDTALLRFLLFQMEPTLSRRPTERFKVIWKKKQRVHTDPLGHHFIPFLDGRVWASYTFPRHTVRVLPTELQGLNIDQWHSPG